MNRMRSRVEEAVLRGPTALRDAAINVYGAYLRVRRFDRSFWRMYRELIESEHRSLEWHRERQEAAFSQLMDYVWARVPFYRRRYEEYGLRRRQIQSLDDLKVLPVLNRSDIRNEFKSLLAEGLSARERVFRATSGTTGEKLRFALTPELQWTAKTAQLYRTYAWAGVGPLERRVTLGGRRFCARAPYWVFNRLENQLLLSVHHLGPDTVEEYARRIEEFKPVFIQGHPSAVAMVARHVLEASNRRIVVRAVFTTGETMLPEQRAYIREAFGGHVIDCYGHGEGAAFASQCPRATGFHELSELGVIELLSEDANEAKGEERVLATSLQNYAMPFIRYDTGDRAVPIEDRRCECGRGLPLVMKEVIGRIDDRIALSARPGDYILPVVARTRLKPFIGVAQSYQLIQTDYDEFTLRLVGTWDEAEREAMCEALKDLVGRRCSIAVQRIGWAEMPSKGGKVRLIQSRVSGGATR
jgi:phenylacetate-CoA ligase